MCKFCLPEGKKCRKLRHRSASGEAWERPATCPLLDMRPTYLLTATASILALAGAYAAGPAKSRAGVPVARSLVTSEIEDSTKTGAVGPGATGPRVVRAQILAGIQLGQQLRRAMEPLAQSFLRGFEAKPLHLRLVLDVGR